MESASGSSLRGARRKRPIKALTLGLLVVFCLILGAVYLEHRGDEDLTIPTPVLPKDNAYDGFVRACALLKPNRHPSPYSMPGLPAQNYTFANFKGCAEDAEPALAELHRNLDKPYLFPFDPSASNPFLSTSQFRELARTVAGAAKYEELCGRPYRAANILLDGIEMGTIVPRGGPLITELVGIAVQAICEKPLEPLLPQLASRELEQVAERLKQIQKKRVPYSDVIIEENYYQTAWTLDWLCTHQGRLKDAEDFIEVGDSWGDRWTAILFLIGNKRAMLHENQVYSRKLADEANRPYSGPSLVRPPANVLSQTTGIQTILPGARNKAVGAEAVVGLLRTETALYRYRAAKGQFPGALADLAPVYLDAPPVDPFGRGQPPRYRALKNGRDFLLYSLGPGMVDRGGLPTKSPGSLGGNIVAGKLWQSRPLPKIVVPASARK